MTAIEKQVYVFFLFFLHKENPCMKQIDITKKKGQT